MLEKAARRVAEMRLDNVRLCWGDAVDLTFADDSFDAVVSSFALAHVGLKERPQALSEMFRVLRPEGRLGLNQASGEQFPGFSTGAQIRDWLGAAGFTEVCIADYDDVYRIVTAKRPD